MDEKPKRRWFRFSLRTMFVVVTVFAIGLGWLAWQIRIVYERKTLIAELNQLGQRFGEKVEGLGVYEQRGASLGEGKEYVRISKFRLWLGDDSYPSIDVRENISPDLLRRVEYAFPESQIIVHSLDKKGWIAIRFPAGQKPQKRNYGNLFETGLVEK